MEGGNTREYANLVPQTDEYGNPVGENMDMSGREGLSTNVGHASGGAGCHYDFGDTTAGFGAAGVYLNQLISDKCRDCKEKGRNDGHGNDETKEKKKVMEDGSRTDKERTSAVTIDSKENNLSVYHTRV